MNRGRTLHFDGEKLILYCPYAEENSERALQAGGFLDRRDLAWNFLPGNVLRVVKFWNLLPGELTPQAMEVFKGADGLERTKEEVLAIRRNGGLPSDYPLPGGFAFKTVPYAHQREAFLLGSRFDGYALLFEMGAMKSKVALDLFRLRVKQGKARKLLILCPHSVVGPWKEQVAEHTKITPDRVTAIKDEYRKGKTPPRAELLAKFLDPADRRNVCIFHYDVVHTMATRFSEDDDRRTLRAFVRANRGNLRSCMGIADESTRLKSVGADRTHFAHQLFDALPFRLILTGAMVPKDPFDFWSQWRMVDLGQALGTSFRRWRNKNFERGILSMEWHPRPGTLERLHELTMAQGYRVLADDCLDLPPKVYHRREVWMGPRQKEAYDDLSRRLLAEIEGERVSCRAAIAKFAKLSTITAGFAISDAGEVVHVENPKLKVLGEVLEQVGDGKAVVFAFHQESVREIVNAPFAKELGAIALHGPTSDRAEEIIRKFQTDPGCRLLVANQGSGGMGIDLSVANHAIFFSNDFFNWESRAQSEARVRRKGSEGHRTITYTDIVVPGTIDVAMLKSFGRKEEVNAAIVDGKLDLRKLAEGQIEIKEGGWSK